ncbi:hypothetical protein AB0J74_23590 [Asanoa sp. NPDC049573]|uniref:hypothetical protein n=1 Tax=Asanoa sp. NPDC049573 TaxID=3155396 RepID=UPI00343162B6
MNFDQLRADLGDLADEVQSVDLHERALATSRRLARRRAMATGAAAAVVVVAAGGIALSGLLGGDRPPVGPANTPSATAPPTITPGPTVTATTTPPAAPLKALTTAEVRQATIDVPAWRTDACPDGRQPVPNTNTDDRNLTVTGDVVLADVDRDGAGDALILLRCRAYPRPGADEVIEDQVLALHRAADGSVATLGRVVANRPEPGGGVLGEVQAVAGGGIRVLWFDSQPGHPDNGFQWRVYGWNGSGFAQTGGPASFPKITVDLKISATKTVKLTRDPSDAWTGDLVITVTNAGNRTATDATVTLELPVPAVVQSMTGAAGKLPTVASQGPPRILTAALKPLAAGKSVTVTMRLVYPGDAAPGGGTVRIGAVGDKSPANNSAAFGVDPVE